MQKLSIAYSTDEKFVKITAVSIASLLKSNPGARITVLCNGVSAASVEFLRNLCARLGGVFTAVDVQTRLADLERRGANGYVSYSAYARLFIPQLMEDTRVIYLDGDTIVTGDLSPLAALDLGGRPFAIGYDCQRIEYKKMIGLPLDAPYYNSGVLVIDTAEWTRRNCTPRLLDALAKANGRAFFADQDLIVHALSGEAAILPPQFNFLTHFQMFRTQRDVLTITGAPSTVWYTAEAYAAARKAPVIHHFLGHTLGRPWYRESKNPLRPLYREFAALAGVPEVAEQSRPLDFCYRVQWLCWKLLPYPLFIQACRAMYRYFFWHAYGV